MRKTKAQQEQTRVQIILSTVELVTRDGYESVTMKDIARNAGIGDATIYKYFPSKDRLILGYFDLVVQEAIEVTRSTPGIEDYDLQSRLQRLTDAVLERLMPDREFVSIAQQLVLKAPLMMLGDHMQAKQLLKDVVLADLVQAVSEAEIPDSDFLQLLSGLYVDYCFGIIAYWLKDTSLEQADTTRFVDQTLGILVVMMKSGLPDRMVQLGLFVVRSQIARLMTDVDSASGDNALQKASKPRRSAGDNKENHEQSVEPKGVKKVLKKTSKRVAKKKSVRKGRLNS